MSPNQTFVRSVELPVGPAVAFAYHQRPGALQRLLPPWQSITIESSAGSIEPGSRVVLRMGVGALSLRWVALHTVLDPPRRFDDIQHSGPMAHWHHRHQFEPIDESRTRMTDAIEYRLPRGALGQFLAGRFTDRQLQAMFAFRHRVTADDLELQSRYALPPQRVAVSGSSGLVGSQLVPLLGTLGHDVRTLVRKKPTSGTQVQAWGEGADVAALGGSDAVIHLAGKPIAEKRWTDRVKEEIRSSRVDLTRQLCERLAALPDPPRVLLCASAVGIYGDRGDQRLDEQSPPADDFLGSVAQQWEAACDPARQAGIRVVHLRFGVILSPQGGALQKMLTPARMGAGGPVGSGQQWWSWIALDDALGAIYHALAREEIHGPVNVVAPQPVTSREFAKTLGTVLHRPACFPTPAFSLRLLLGEMADALLLSSARVVPDVLQKTGYRFRFETLEAALRHLLGREV